MSSTRTALHEEDICYEDNHFIAVNKLAGDLVQGDASGDTSLTELLKQFLKTKYDKPGNVFAAPCHRLDRPVQGIVLFAKTSKGASRMAQLFASNKIKKSYLAIVEGVPEKAEGILESYLWKDRRLNIVQSSHRQTAESKLAQTDYELIQSKGDKSLLRLYPRTGRSHQLRVHMARELKHPICGDIKYGASEKTNDRSLYLFAQSLEFVHPIKKEPIRIMTAAPTKGYWKEFVDNIQ